MKRLAPILYLALVFLCGIAVGVFGLRYYEQAVSANVAAAPRNPVEWKKRHMNDLRNRLHLTPDQETKISGILDDAGRKVHDLMDRNRPEMTRIQNDQYAEIKSVLTPDQAAEFDKMHAERERRRAERHGGGPPF